MTEEELQEHIEKLAKMFEPGKFTGDVEQIHLAYGDLVNAIEETFPRELKAAMEAYEQGQIDARANDIVMRQLDHMQTLKDDEQKRGNQVAVNQAKTAATRHLPGDPVYQQQREEYRDALTAANENRLNLIYDAERATLIALGLEISQDSPGQAVQRPDRIEANLDLAEAFSNHQVNFAALLEVEQSFEGPKEPAIPVRSVGMSRDQFHALVTTAQERDPENER